MSKKLVCYFSAEAGRTKRAAQQIADAAGLDIYEIKPKVPYTRDDLYWPNDKCRSVVETLDRSFRPELADHDAPIADYDTILIGYPLWCHGCPTIINTFLESYDFSNKKVVLFMTSGGNGFMHSAEWLRPSVPDSCTITEGINCNRPMSKEKLAEWVASLD